MTASINIVSPAEPVSSPKKWHGCYDEGWKGEISDESFAHPAKFSRALIRRIYEYTLAQGYIKPGDTILDPFGGIGLGAIDALANGLNWIGVELEPKFVDLGAGCDCTGISKADWVRFYGRWARANHKEGRHWCPECLAQAGEIIEPSPQLGFFETKPTASYVQSSGQIPTTKPHYYNGNLDRFRRYASGGAQAVLLQGDSRKLVEIVRGDMAAMRSSPPFGQAVACQDPSYETGRKNGGGPLYGDYGKSPGQLGAMPEGDPAAVISSPPFAGNSGGRGEVSRQGIDAALFDRHQGGMIGGMGNEPGNLGNLPQGQIAAAISSPPYVSGGHHPDQTGAWGGQAQSVNRNEASYGQSNGQLGQLKEGDLAGVISSPPFAGSVGSDDPQKRGGILVSDPKRAGDRNLTGSYGNSPGQLGAMSLKAAMKSPPYEGIDLGYGDRPNRWEKVKDNPNFKGRTKWENYTERPDYGNSSGQVGRESGETFWQAARLIVEQCYELLAEDAVLIWVTKRFVRNGEIVEFSHMWRSLCESVGFEHIETIRAMLVKSNGRQIDLEGEVVEKFTERKSFFRRLHEKKSPETKIDWEDVIIMRKRSCMT